MRASCLILLKTKGRTKSLRVRRTLAPISERTNYVRKYGLLPHGSDTIFIQGYLFHKFVNLVPRDRECASPAL